MFSDCPIGGFVNSYMLFLAWFTMWLPCNRVVVLCTCVNCPFRCNEFWFYARILLLLFAKHGIVNYRMLIGKM